MFGSSLSGILLLASLVTVQAAPETSSHRFEKRGTFGPISTGAPNLAGGNAVCDAAPISSFFAGMKPPYPTNSWWAPYATSPGNQTAAGPFPYESWLEGSGVTFGVSTNRQFDGTSVKNPSQTDWTASFSEHSGAIDKHKALGWDTQTVTVQYFEGSSSMTAYLVPGSPYMTFKYDGATPVLTSKNGDIKTFNGKTLNTGDSTSATGKSFTVTNSKGGAYIIYALSSITLTATSAGTITASGKYNDILRLAMLNNPSHQALLDQHSSIYATAMDMDFSFTDSQGTMFFNWKTVGDADNLLMLTWPHHRASLQNPNYPATSSLNYLTTKGWMYPALGSQWRLTYKLPAITWNAPRKLDNSCSQSVIRGLEYEIGQLNASDPAVPGDFYYWGGTMAAKARLALIAEDVGRNDLVNPVVQYLKASFAAWFQSSAKTLAAYETGWGAVINKAGATNTWVDFGNGYMNDHHFHYGYFLNVAAVIAKYDGDWLNQHKDYINLFARDIVNPSSQDPYFPVTRCRDFFAGHSWASGIANGAGSRDQESSGEAVNGYYGALLWASVALSQDHVNYAKLMLATEQQASQVYWHLYPQQGENDRDNPYPEAGVRKLVSMGNVMDFQSGAWLFWGAQRVQISGIQVLPVTPVNEVLYDKQWVDNMWDYTMPELVDPSIGDDFKCVIIAAYANSNPQVAAEWSSKLTSWGSGNTYTNELYFIGTRPNPSGQAICGKLPENPYGKFKLQVASSGKYVAASSSNSKLVASGNDAGSAAVFNSQYVPNAGTLQLDSTKQYVTADQGGKSTLDAARATASAWEKFTIRPKAGAPDGVYSIKASSNGQYVTVGSDGGLVNNGANESDSAGFKFVA